MRYFGLMLLPMVLVLAPAASAQPQEGVYFTPKIGYSSLEADSSAQIEAVGLGRVSGKDKSTKGQAVLGLAVGYDFNLVNDVPLRAEFEYAWRGKKEMVNERFDAVNPPNDGNIKSKVGAQSFFFNGYFDIHNDSPVTPYIGAGLGLARVSSESLVTIDNVPGNMSISKTKTNFAWNIGAGAAFEISDSVVLDVGYRYADFGKVDGSTSVVVPPYTINASMDTKVKTHEVLLGLRFTM